MKEFAFCASIIGFMVVMTIIRHRSRQDEMAIAQFSWKNYTKPTPANLLYWSSVMRDCITFLTTFSIIMDAHWLVPVIIQIIGFLLDKAKNFFAMVEEDIKTESTTAVFPSGSEVTVTQEIPKGPLDSGEQEI